MKRVATRESPLIKHEASDSLDLGGSSLRYTIRFLEEIDEKEETKGTTFLPN